MNTEAALVDHSAYPPVPSVQIPVHASADTIAFGGSTAEDRLRDDIVGRSAALRRVLAIPRTLDETRWAIGSPRGPRCASASNAVARLDDAPAEHRQTGSRATGALTKRRCPATPRR